MGMIETLDDASRIEMPLCFLHRPLAERETL